MCWVYRMTPDGSGGRNYTVGYYAPRTDGEGTWYDWEPVADFNKEHEAQRLVSYLNGGADWRL